MGIAKLYGQSGSGGFKPNGIIHDYYVYAGERIEKGDFVELLTGSNGDEKETQVRKATTPDIYGVAKTSGMGAYKTVEYTIPEGESVNKGDTVKYYANVISNENIIPTTWTAENDNKFISDAGIILSNSSFVLYNGSHRFVYLACDGDTTTYWMTQNEINPWLKLEFPTATKIMKMKTWITRSLYNFTNVKIQGSNDDSIWDDLYTLTSFQSSLTEITLNNPDYYKYYRIYYTFPSGSVGYSTVYELQVSECVGLSDTPQNGTALQSGTAGDTIQIAVPVTDEESTGHKDMIKVYQPYPEKRLVMADGNILTTSNGDVFLLKEAI